LVVGGIGGHPAEVKCGGGYAGNVCTEEWVNLVEKGRSNESHM
jgi:hydroxymethylglutaryl-CoA lyase